MALTSIPKGTSTSAPKADKAISISHYNGTTDRNSVYYTVPEGRKFKGIFWVNDYSYELGKFPGHTGNAHYNTFGSNSNLSFYPIETAAGDFVSGNSNYAYHSVVGIESDA